MSMTDFFSLHREKLEEFYPGLSVRRLEQELSLILSQGKTKEYFQEALLKGIPLGYIAGVSPFYKHDFFVNSNVLIPRFETEIMVEMAVGKLRQIASKKMPSTIIDVGTGSGCILLSILSDCAFPVRAFGTDLSFDALHVANMNKENLEKNFHPLTEVKFVCQDRLEHFPYKAQLIVSNPPYIKRREDIQKVHSKVLEFEPELALFLDDRIYDEWFYTFFEQAFTLLEPEGVFLMEGHEDHLCDLKKIAESVGFFSVSLKNDYTGRERFLIAEK